LFHGPTFLPKSKFAPRRSRYSDLRFARQIVRRDGSRWWAAVRSAKPIPWPLYGFAGVRPTPAAHFRRKNPTVSEEWAFAEGARGAVDFAVECARTTGLQPRSRLFIRPSPPARPPSFPDQRQTGLPPSLPFRGVIGRQMPIAKPGGFLRIENFPATTAASSGRRRARRPVAGAARGRQPTDGFFLFLFRAAAPPAARHFFFSEAPPQSPAATTTNAEFFFSSFFSLARTKNITASLPKSPGGPWARCAENLRPPPPEPSLRFRGSRAATPAAFSAGRRGGGPSSQRTRTASAPRHRRPNTNATTVRGAGNRRRFFIFTFIHSFFIHRP